MSLLIEIVEATNPLMGLGSGHRKPGGGRVSSYSHVPGAWTLSVYRSVRPSWAHSISSSFPPRLNEGLLGVIRVRTLRGCRYHAPCVQILPVLLPSFGFRQTTSLCLSSPSFEDPRVGPRPVLSTMPSTWEQPRHELVTTRRPGPTKAFVSLLGKQAPSWPGLGLLGQEGRASTWVLGSGPQKSLAGLPGSGYWC